MKKRKLSRKTCALQFQKCVFREWFLSWCMIPPKWAHLLFPHLLSLPLTRFPTTITFPTSFRCLFPLESVPSLMSCNLLSGRQSVSCRRLTFVLSPLTRTLNGMLLFHERVFAFLRRLAISTISFLYSRNATWTCLCFSQEVGNLYHQLSLLKECNKQSSSMCKMDEFAKSTFPLIKRVSHSMFIKIIFPSMAEVTTTTPTALASYGLSSTCPLVNHIFDEIVFKPHGTSNQYAIPTFIDNLLSTHRYDNAVIRKELWDNYGIGSFAVKEVGCMQNTVTNLCCDATSKSHLFLFPIMTLFWPPSYCLFRSRGHFLSCWSHLCCPY